MRETPFQSTVRVWKQNVNVIISVGLWEVSVCQLLFPFEALILCAFRREKTRLNETLNFRFTHRERKLKQYYIHETVRGSWVLNCFNYFHFRSVFFLFQSILLFFCCRSRFLCSFPSDQSCGALVGCPAHAKLLIVNESLHTPSNLWDSHMFVCAWCMAMWHDIMDIQRFNVISISYVHRAYTFPVLTQQYSVCFCIEVIRWTYYDFKIKCEYVTRQSKYQSCRSLFQYLHMHTLCGIMRQLTNRRWINNFLWILCMFRDFVRIPLLRFG